MTNKNELPLIAKKLVHFLACQSPIAYEPNNWKKLDYESVRRDKVIIIIIPSVEIGFVFNNDGEFLGIYNYKE